MNDDTSNGIGICYLTKSDDGDPPIDLSRIDFTNPVWQCLALRTQWQRVQPSETEFYWDFLDQGMSLAAQHGKKVSILVTAGVTTPEWVYGAGAERFMVTEQAGGEPVPMPLPWDKVFRKKWSAFVATLAARYPNLAYVVMGGFGRRAESFFVTTPEDQAALDAAAQRDGYADGMTAWLQGAKWCVQQYANHFSTKIVCDCGSPSPAPNGETSLESLLDWGIATYPGKFWVKSDGLLPNGPPANSPAVVRMPTAGGGFQFSLPMRGDVERMRESLDRGVGFGARFIETYGNDCDDPSQAANLTEAANEMIGR